MRRLCSTCQLHDSCRTVSNAWSAPCRYVRLCVMISRADASWPDDLTESDIRLLGTRERLAASNPMVKYRSWTSFNTPSAAINPGRTQTNRASG